MEFPKDKLIQLFGKMEEEKLVIRYLHELPLLNESEYSKFLKEMKGWKS